jgi:translocation protein SEC63
MYYLFLPRRILDLNSRLTDETIRQNWERYGHPDGRQEVSMGIALPKTIIEGRNRTIVLAAYGLIFGGMLPALVGRWWFGNREKTKDGVNARSAAVFFKSLGEDSGIDDVVASLGKSYEYERPKKSTGHTVELNELEKKVELALGLKWLELKKLAEVTVKQSEARRHAFVLIYAHLLRIPVENAALRRGKLRHLHERIPLTTLQNNRQFCFKPRPYSTPY